MLRGVVYRLIEYLASMGHSSIWKLICANSVSNILTVGVHLSSTPSISGPGSATGCADILDIFKVSMGGIKLIIYVFRITLRVSKSMNYWLIWRK